MFWLKSCPQCRGDLYETSDIYGIYIDCFQCGHYLTTAEEAHVRFAAYLGSYTRLSRRPVRVLTEIAA